MIKNNVKLFIKSAGAGFLLLMMSGLSGMAHAIPVAFDLNIVMTETNADVGTGVDIGDAYTGTMFFDSIDLAPDGSRFRTILPGGDSITIASIIFDTTLVDTFYGFTFVGGVPLCIGDYSLDGCSTGEGQSIPKADGDDLIFYDNFFGRVRDSSGGPFGPYEFASFSYSFSRSAGVPEPAILALLSIGLIGVGVSMRSRNKR